MCTHIIFVIWTPLAFAKIWYDFIHDPSSDYIAQIKFTELFCHNELFAINSVDQCESRFSR